jgi:hypothetical protein
MHLQYTWLNFYSCKSIVHGRKRIKNSGIWSKHKITIHDFIPVEKRENILCHLLVVETIVSCEVNQTMQLYDFFDKNKWENICIPYRLSNW